MSVCTCMRVSGQKKVNRKGVFVCVVRFVIGCSGPYQSLPELVICMALIDS